MFVCGPSNLFYALNQVCPCIQTHQYASTTSGVYCKKCFKRFELAPIQKCTNVLHFFSMTMIDNIISIDCLECQSHTTISVEFPIISPIYFHNLDEQGKNTLKRVVTNALNSESRPLNKDKVSKKIKTPILDQILTMIGYVFEKDEYILKNVYEETCSILLAYLDFTFASNEDAQIMALTYFLDGLSMSDYEKSKPVPITDYYHKSIAPAYSELGCIDFTDDLVIYAFRKALTHVKDLIKYTTLLHQIGMGRNSSKLMLDYYMHNKYVVAFNYFGTSNSNEMDSFYVGLYRIRLSDTPNEALKAKKMLQLVGEYIQSETILQMCHSSDELTGLGNSGVSCHLNACLQCLAHIEPFRTSIVLSDNKLSSLLSDLFANMASKSYVFPNQELIEILFGAAQQQDASECLEKIIDQIGPTVCQDIFGFQLENEIEHVYRLDVNTPILSIVENKFNKFPNVFLIQINVLNANVEIVYG